MQSLLQLKNYDCVIWALYLDTQGEVADDRINKIKIKFLYQQICVFLLMSNDSEKNPDYWVITSRVPTGIMVLFPEPIVHRSLPFFW